MDLNLVPKYTFTNLLFLDMSSVVDYKINSWRYDTSKIGWWLFGHPELRILKVTDGVPLVMFISIGNVYSNVFMFIYWKLIGTFNFDTV